MNKFNYNIITLALFLMPIGYAMEEGMEEEQEKRLAEEQARKAKVVQEAEKLQHWIKYSEEKLETKKETEFFLSIHRIQEYYGKSPEEMTGKELRNNFSQAPYWMKNNLWKYITDSNRVDEVIPEVKETRIKWIDIKD